MAINLFEPRNISLDSSIGEAFKLLAGTFGMVITIVDNRGVLEGIVTDGDLRNALLNGQSIETKLANVMNSRPVTLQMCDIDGGIDIEWIRNQLEERGAPTSDVGNMWAIPVVDEKGVVKGLTTLQMQNFLGKTDLENNRGIPNVLVVGGAGYIGSVLVEKILDRGWKVKVLDRLIYGGDSLRQFMGNKNWSFVNGDVCNLTTQVEAIRGVNCVVFLAEIVGDPSCKYVPETALTTNYLAVNSMASLCAQLHIHRFIYTSSCSVYGASSNPDVILDENSELNPASHYTRMKIASEESLLKQSNPLFAPTILRLATVFGMSHRPRFDLVVNTFAKNAYLRKLVKVNGGGQWRPNVHVSDVSETIIRLLQSPIDDVSGQIFNVGSNSENHTIKKISELVCSVFPECDVEIHDSDLDQRNYRVDFGKIKSFLGYEPEISVLQGLEEFKLAFEQGNISDLDSQEYSNIETLKEYYPIAS